MGAAGARAPEPPPAQANHPPHRAAPPLALRVAPPPPHGGGGGRDRLRGRGARDVAHLGGVQRRRPRGARVHRRDRGRRGPAGGDRGAVPPLRRGPAGRADRHGGPLLDGPPRAPRARGPRRGALTVTATNVTAAAVGALETT